MSSPSTAVRAVILESITQTESSTTATSTVAPYDTGLNGVDQPMNLLFKDVLWTTLGVIGVLILVVRIVCLGLSWIRQVSTMPMPAHSQGYWKRQQWNWMPKLKKHLIYSPLWKKRHTKEIRLSSALSVGTLPSRFQTLILAVYVISNFVYMFVLGWTQENKFALCAELRGRSGTLALVNMVPLFIFAGRNNPLIPILKISFDTYNLLHRWMGRLVAIESIIHAIAWLIVQVADGGWTSVWDKMANNRFIGSGTVGVLCIAVLAVLAVGPVRHAFYETFVNIHIILAFTIAACTYIHCASAVVPGGLPQLPWIIALILLWAAERLVRMVRLVYYNYRGQGWPEAVAEYLPGDVTRVTLRVPRYVDIKPGSHAYLRFKGLNVWESHPFSIAWVQHHPDDNVLPTNEKEHALAEKMVATSVSFVIGAQTGMTRRLFNAAKASGSHIIIPTLLEGPYAGHHCLDSYGHLVLFAGATGITHQLSYLKHLMDGYNEGIVSTRRITLVWVVRDSESLEWVRPWMDQILNLPNRTKVLTVKLFVTRPKNSREISSGSNMVQMFPGRPNIQMLLRREVHEQVGAMCVSVCGPGSLADDVRAAAREVQDEHTVVDFIEESFTW